jgi:hypothetical protein
VAEEKGSRVESSRVRSRGDQLIVGRLTEHGVANYQFRQGQETTYYLKVLTNRGLRTLWGKDLKRALDAAVTQPKTGDLIGAQRIAREAVTVTQRQRDAQGRVVSQTEHHAHRNRWRVEKIQFFADRARLARQVRDAHVDAREVVRNRPELKSTFLSLRGAEELAARRIADPKDRERFLALVREAIANSISKGEPLPAVRIRERPKTLERATAPSRPSKRDDGPTR